MLRILICKFKNVYYYKLVARNSEGHTVLMLESDVTFGNRQDAIDAASDHLGLLVHSATTSFPKATRDNDEDALEGC